MNSDKEQIYDNEIAPLLLKIAKIAEEHSIALTCLVQWAHGESGRTETRPHGLWAETRIASYAVRCNGNADDLIFVLQKDGKKYGHSSICLHLLENAQK
jgi:hypothetical protein